MAFGNNAFRHFPINLSLKADKELKDIEIVINASLNSDGGELLLSFGGAQDLSQLINVSKTEIEKFIKKIEQFCQRTAGLCTTMSNINFQRSLYSKKIIVTVKRAKRMITVKYNFVLPTETQASVVTPLQSSQEIGDVILSRKVVVSPINLGSHQRKFVEKQNCQFNEGKVVQLKMLKASASKRTTLADRMTGKSNGFTSYVSAFANHRGGHIYYGIRDDGVVEGELIPDKDDIDKIKKRVESTINKMIWPERIGKPKRGVQWEIFFVQVVDEDSNRIPLTFVIVIYIAPCLGGVFIEAPESYEIVEGEVQKMSFAAWKSRLLHENVSGNHGDHAQTHRHHRLPSRNTLGSLGWSFSW